MIAVIADNDVLRPGPISFLHRRDYSVHVPEHRQNAMVLVQDNKLNVIVLDMHNTKPNGLTFLKNLREWGIQEKSLF